MPGRSKASQSGDLARSLPAPEQPTFHGGETTQICSSIALSGQDHAVLLALMSGEQQVSRRAIIEALGENYLEYDQRRLDTQIRRLRRKVREASAHVLPVTTLRTVGFRFDQKATICRQGSGVLLQCSVSLRNR